jgi:5'-3' exonuclease
MTENGLPWVKKTPEEYFSEDSGPLVMHSDTEYPTDIGREAWLLEQVPKIGPSKARELLRRYGIVAEIPYNEQPRRVVASVNKLSWDAVQPLQASLKHLNEEGIIQGTERDSEGNPFTVFDPKSFVQQ